MICITKTCHEHKHPEIEFQCDDSLAFEAPYLISWLENLVALGKVLRAGDMLQIGWSLAKIEYAGRGKLTLWELDYEAMPVNYVHSLSKTLISLRKQRAVAESFGMGQKTKFPSMWHSALQCKNFATAADCMITRAKPAGKNDSGWFMGCLDEQHNHDNPANLERGYLYALARQKPAVIEYLALPEGVLIVLDAEGNLVAARDEKDKELAVRAGSYLEKKKAAI
jgi:hypothetical protein